MIPGRPAQHAYCTYFDRGYLSRGLTLIESLRQHGDEAPIWILALDAATKTYLDDLALPHTHTLTIEDLEAAEPELAPLRTGRSQMEYYFTSTPLLVRYVVNSVGDDHPTTVIYLDADLYFFDSPQLVLTALGEKSVGIIEHRYPRRVASRLAPYGRFNVGWVGFRNDDKGRACLNWWAASTLTWCFDRPENGKYADQGYLDSFPEFDGVAILRLAGLNLAPWNTARHRLTKTSDGHILVDGDPLIFFHFHGLRRVGQRYVTSQLIYASPLNDILRNEIYLPYLSRLEATSNLVDLPSGGQPSALKRGNGWRGVASRLRKWVSDRATILSGNAIPVKRLARGSKGAPR